MRQEKTQNFPDHKETLQCEPQSFHYRLCPKGESFSDGMLFDMDT